ncbi:AAA domain-containing protein [Dyadobacter sp. CY351]|uniref:AAA domain-containing protein n=1 Tax=Dyadobacter sp. CY351 TaxID=2909337 RepID=UPI001F236D70|nr:AAA domain-containing protein [Dyadobacter sp. CY351]MCF2516008.1 AAA domain-containing protein [Dyadobacter sp. CY351]
MNKDKYLQIFNYLLEFSKLRSKSIRNIEQSKDAYPEVLWIGDLPNYENVDNILSDSYNVEADYFLKVGKPRNEPDLPQFAKLPDALSEWIDPQSLTKDHVIPLLHVSIEKDGLTFWLKEHQHIQGIFDSYVEEQWILDKEDYRERLTSYNQQKADFDKKDSIYRRLFSIFNKSQQFFEEYELVLGVGLLNFQESDSTPSICRHSFVSKTEISFESSKQDSFVKVALAVDSAIKVETDAIMDLADQFDSSDIVEAEKSVLTYLDKTGIGDNLWDEKIHEALQTFADRIRQDGSYKSNNRKSTITDTKPTIYYAPALLLRRRNTQSLTSIYESIISNLNSASESLSIETLNGLIDLAHDENINTGGFDSDKLLKWQEDEQIYFPKKYNLEQLDIVHKSRKRSKVLVQGPPGTGKSHTIANLICHLLANGNKILVTAQKKRALEVLKGQLPEEFQSLAVNLLSGDASSIMDLEASVSAVNEKVSSITDLDEFKKAIRQKVSELDAINKKHKALEHQLIRVKEKDTYRQWINDDYSGTLFEIAQKIEADSPLHNWYQDDYVGPHDVLASEIFRLQELYSLSSSGEFIHLDLSIPTENLLLRPTLLESYISIQNEFDELGHTTNSRISLTTTSFDELESLLENCIAVKKKIDDVDLPFKQNIHRDLPRRKSFWEEKLSRSKLLLEDLDNDGFRNLDRRFEIKYPTGKSWIQLRADCLALLQYIQSGGLLSGMLFTIRKALLPKEIKEKLYIINEITVNGSPCDTESEMRAVLSDIEVKEKLELLQELWDEGVIPARRYVDKISHFQFLIGEYEHLMSNVDEVRVISDKIFELSSLNVSSLESVVLTNILKDVKHCHLASQTRKNLSDIQIHVKGLHQVYSHPIIGEISDALLGLNLDSYKKLLSRLQDLHDKQGIFQEYKRLVEDLVFKIPKLTNDILANTFDWSNITNLKEAISFKQAVTEVGVLLDEHSESNLQREILELEKEQEKLMSTVAAEKAWQHVLERLNENVEIKKHLQAWVMAVKKIGKTGKGKTALRFRREAQVQMEKCQDSVPCWIMPLFKIAETVKPQAGMYDYVIIDEASQLGPDAIFLLYIAKKVIIVGDDKQTSPEYVGVDADTMTPHIRRHLQGIPFDKYYGTEFSFFDHAKIFCEGLTILREHFRCMPEIIEFCNKNFYAPENKSLYPLKQYSENRLEPLMTIFSPTGEVNGSSSNISNKVEAVEIASKISELIKDVAYKGKSIGVIALQGNKQASLIESEIIQKIGEVEFKKREIACGNSASFQGDERDIMFLSLVTARNHPRAALTKPEDERRFNVAVSRAKEQIWLAHSVQLGDLTNSNDLRFKLLDHFQNYRPQPVPMRGLIDRKFGNQPEPFDSWFEVDVYNDIVARGYAAIPQYDVVKGRYRLDLVVILGNGKKIAVECDGDKYHGAEHYQNDIVRQKVLERSGWQFFRVRGGVYYTDRIKAMEPLWELLTRNGSVPEIKTNRIFIPEDTSKSIDLNNATQLDGSIKDSNYVQNELFNISTPSPFADTSASNGRLAIDMHPDTLHRKEILIFSDRQNVYKLKNQSFHTQLEILDLIELEENENPIYITGTDNYSGHLMVGFNNGKLAKISFSAYRTEQNRKKLKNAYSSDASLLLIRHVEDDIDLIVSSSKNKIVLFNTSKINAVESKLSKGVWVMKLKEGSHLTGMKTIDQVKFEDPEYYRKETQLSLVVGYYLRLGDEF